MAAVALFSSFNLQVQYEATQLLGVLVTVEPLEEAVLSQLVALLQALPPLCPLLPPLALATPPHPRDSP